MLQDQIARFWIMQNSIIHIVNKLHETLINFRMVS